MAVEGRGTDPVHSRRIPRQQRAAGPALLSLLLLLVAAPLAAQEFDLDPTILQEEFDRLTAIAGDAIFASPVDAPGRTGLLSFEISVAGTGVPVDEDSAYWAAAGAPDILIGGRLPIGRVVVSKGIGLGSVSLSYGKVFDSDIAVLGGSVDVPIWDGGLVRPTIALRGVYSQLQGEEQVDLTTWGAQLLVGKKFGPLTPYGGIGYRRIDSEAHIETGFEPVNLESQIDGTAFVVGARFSLLLPVVAVEATQGEEEWVVAARVGFGF